MIVNGPAYGADIDEAPRSSMDELAAWTVEADQVLTF